MSNDRALITNIRTTAKRAGIALPAELEHTIEEAGRIETALPAPDRRTLTEAVAAAALAGKDPATDKAVQRELFAYQLAQTVPSTTLGQVADDRRARAFAAHADAIIEDLVEAVDEMDTILTEAREVLPALDLRNPSQASRVSPAQAQAWARARDAAARFEHVVQCWSMLVRLTRAADVTPIYRALIAAPLSLEELHALGHNPNAIDVLHAGHALSLATPTEYRERVERVTADRRNAITAAEDAWKDKTRTRFGVGAA